jgi:hypothetical protein
VNPNWLMLSGTRQAGPGLLDLRAMGVIDRVVYRQDGRSAGSSHHGETVAPAEGDVETTQASFMELAGRYTWNVDARTSFFAYAAPFGEPALGPGLFQHRPSAADNHHLPLGLAISDGAHALPGVLTLGMRRDAAQFEFSRFNARLAGFASLDSWSSRVSYFPGSAWALQLSGGALQDAEAAAPGTRPRGSASVQHTTETRWGTLSTTASAAHEFATERPRLGLLLESQLDSRDGGHLYGRIEHATRFASPTELAPVQGVTLGYAHDLGPQAFLSGALGGDASIVAVAGKQEGIFMLYARLRAPGF